MPCNGSTRHTSATKAHPPLHLLLPPPTSGSYLSQDYPSSITVPCSVRQPHWHSMHHFMQVNSLPPPVPPSPPYRTLAGKDAVIQHHTLSLRIRASKTDQQHTGQTLLIGCAGTPTCLPSDSSNHISSSVHIIMSPLFHFSNHRYPTHNSFTSALKESLLAVGENQQRFSSELVVPWQLLLLELHRQDLRHRHSRCFK